MNLSTWEGLSDGACLRGGLVGWSVPSWRDCRMELVFMEGLLEGACLRGEQADDDIDIDLV